MIIRSKDFRSWFKANLSASARDICNHGADAGYPCITYTADTVKIFDRFGAEIWQMACDEADDQGINVCTMIAGFGRNDMTMGGLDQFKNLMVWYACEKLARELEG